MEKVGSKMYYNIEKLRRDLMDYFGTAMSNGLDMAVIDLSEIENASPDKLVEIAEKNGFNINNYMEEYER